MCIYRHIHMYINTRWGFYFFQMRMTANLRLQKIHLRISLVKDWNIIHTLDALPQRTVTKMSLLFCSWSRDSEFLILPGLCCTCKYPGQ